MRCACPTHREATTACSYCRVKGELWDSADSYKGSCGALDGGSLLQSLSPHRSKGSWPELVIWNPYTNIVVPPLEYQGPAFQNQPTEGQRNEGPDSGPILQALDGIGAAWTPKVCKITSPNNSDEPARRIFYIFLAPQPPQRQYPKYLQNQLFGFQNPVI